MSKLTKIIATIGPASEDEAILTEMISSGMNVARFNTKHSDPSWHNTVITRVYELAERMGKHVGVLLDLQGPEVRINTKDGASFDLAVGEEMLLTDLEQRLEQETALVPSEVIVGLSVGDSILFEDGAAELRITDKRDHELTAAAVVDCTIKHRKTMNTPGVVLNMPSLTTRDREFLEGVDLRHVDFVGLSFVRNRHDVEILRHALDEKGCTAKIVAKIENQTALDNLNELIESSDLVMVARGDLGVEVPYEQLIFWQKKIIDLCRQHGKPVITATEMLKSMVTNPRPTRAEVSDVAHAIYDGTDAIMLSDETTTGKFPLKAVQTQATIAAYNEPFAVVTSNHTNSKHSWSSSLSASMMTLLTDSPEPISHIICLTETGSTAQMLASYHPRVPIIALTSRDFIARQLSVVYGVESAVVSLELGSTLSSDKILSVLKQLQIGQTGERVLMLYGPVWQEPHQTNTITIETLL